ncbi:hypothetical protein AB8A21_21145 [Streptomyces sp. BF23-18]|uniref:hypothetical protein n=1 Tax=Streptomyces sp. BF23-18 TaxID=3240282 RepID=UPI0034E4305A
MHDQQSRHTRTLPRRPPPPQALGNVTRVDNLPFHKFGAGKWAGLGMNFTLASTPVPSAARIAEARSVFASYGLYAV